MQDYQTEDYENEDSGFYRIDHSPVEFEFIVQVKDTDFEKNDY
jgi:hypothetical protein